MLAVFYLSGLMDRRSERLHGLLVTRWGMGTCRGEVRNELEGNGFANVCFLDYQANAKVWRTQETTSDYWGTDPLVYSRTRRTYFKTHYRGYQIVGHEHFIHVVSNSFCRLMANLGVPVGKKTRADFEVPSWIMTAPQWIKRNFLAGFFGAELARPSTVSGHPYNFQQLTLTVSKARKHVKCGIRFLNQIKTLLREFGVESYLTRSIPLTRSTIGLRLVIRSSDDNLAALVAGRVRI